MDVCRQTEPRFDINANAIDLIRTMVGLSPKTYYYISTMIDNNNGRFIVMQGGGLVFSMCYHKTKNHSATAQSWRTAKSTAAPGTWAMAYVRSSFFAIDRASHDYW